MSSFESAVPGAAGRGSEAGSVGRDSLMDINSISSAPKFPACSWDQVLLSLELPGNVGTVTVGTA